MQKASEKRFPRAQAWRRAGCGPWRQIELGAQIKAAAPEPRKMAGTALPRCHAPARLPRPPAMHEQDKARKKQTKGQNTQDKTKTEQISLCLRYLVFALDLDLGKPGELGLHWARVNKSQA